MALFSGSATTIRRWPLQASTRCRAVLGRAGPALTGARAVHPGRRSVDVGALRRRPVQAVGTFVRDARWPDCPRRLDLRALVPLVYEVIVTMSAGRGWRRPHAVVARSSLRAVGDCHRWRDGVVARAHGGRADQPEAFAPSRTRAGRHCRRACRRRTCRARRSRRSAPCPAGACWRRRARASRRRGQPVLSGASSSRRRRSR